MRERIGGTHPPGRSYDGDLSRRKGLPDFARIFHDHCSGNPIGEHIGVLIHRQDRHPVGGSGREADSALEGPDGIGKGAAPRDQQHWMQLRQPLKG